MECDGRQPSSTTTLAAFLRRRGLADESIDKMFLRCGRLADVSPESAAENWDYLCSIGVPERKLPNLFLKCPKILTLGLHERLIPTVQCLSALEAKPGEVAAAVCRFPLLLFHSVEEKLCPLLGFLGSLGISDRQAGRMLLLNPRLISYSIETKFARVVGFLCGLGLRRDGAVGRVLVRNPFLVGYSVEKRLQPTAEFLMSLGLGEHDLQRLVLNFPEMLCRDVEKILRPNLQFLRQCGFDAGQIARLVAGYPPVLIKSVKNSLEPRLRFLVEVMGRGIEEAADCPTFFHHGLKKSLEFRQRQLSQRNVDCSLADMLECSRKKFALKFTQVPCLS